MITGKEWDVDELKKKVDYAKSKMKMEQSNIEKEVKSQEERMVQLQYDVKLAEVKVKEKDKELSLATLKVKELKRNIRYNSLKPLPITPNNQITRKNERGQRVMQSLEGGLLKKRNKAKNALGGKRNSTDDYTRFSSKDGGKDDKNFTGSEIRLEKSESSIISNDKNEGTKKVLDKKTQRFVNAK